MSDIKQNIRDLATLVKAELTLGENGIVTAKEGTFEKTLPEGLTMETVSQVQNHQADLVSAVGLALGELGIESFKKDKKLEQLSLSLAAGKDNIGGIFQRMKQVSGGIAKEGEPAPAMVDKYGILSMKIDVNAHANKGSLKKVRTHLSEEAKRVLGS